MFKKFVNEQDIINSFKQLNTKLEIKILTKYLKFKDEKYFVDKITGLIFNQKYITIEKQNTIVKKSKIKRILSVINIFKFIKIIY